MDAASGTVTIDWTVVIAAVAAVFGFLANTIRTLLKQRTARRIEAGAAPERRHYVHNDVHTNCREEWKTGLQRVEDDIKELKADVREGFRSLHARLDGSR